MTTATPEWLAKNRRASYNAMPGFPWTPAFQLLAGEAVDNGSTIASSIGDRSRILHPDTPDVGQRPSHQDHIHCDIDR